MSTKVRLPVLASAPAPAHVLDDPERAAQVRRLDCRGYDACLAVAAERGWRSFHCRACRAYAAQTPGQRHRDMLGMLQLLAEMQLLTATAPAAPPAPPRTHAGPFLLDLDDTGALPVAATAA